MAQTAPSVFQVQVTGKAYKGPDGLFAFSAVKPLRVVSDQWVKGTVFVARDLMGSSCKIPEMSAHVS